MQMRKNWRIICWEKQLQKSVRMQYIEAYNEFPSKYACSMIYAIIYKKLRNLVVHQVTALA